MIIPGLDAGLARLQLQQATINRQPDYTRQIEHLCGRLSQPQLTIYSSPERFKILCSGRRFGKTFLGLTRLSTWGLARPNAVYWYVAPTYRMAKQIAWRELKRMLPPELIASKNETDLSITLPNDTILALRGAEDPDSLRGVSLSGAVIDEAAFTKPELWFEVLRPALSDQLGPAWFETTPKGLNWVFDLWEAAQDLSNWATFSFTTIQGGQVTPEEVEEARVSLDPRTFRQEFEASFEALSGRVYDRFDRAIHVKPVLPEHIEGCRILLGVDFNVANMSGVLAVRNDRELLVFDEITNAHDTDALGREVRSRYPQATIDGYPDASGAARSTNSSRSDVAILQAYGISNMSPKANPPVRDRVNTVQSMFENHKGEHRMRIDPKCKGLIKCLELQTWNDRGEPDKESGFDHLNDALGYICHRLFQVGQATAGKPVRGIRVY